MKIVIVDDERDAVGSLEILLNEYCPQHIIVGKAFSVIEAIKELQIKKPDLVFLDIEMPHGTGFDVLESIPDRNFAVIFTTAYAEYAIKAIKSKAIDYLLKPIDIEELILAVEKAEEHNEKKSSAVADKKKSDGSIVTHTPQKIALGTNEGTEFVNLDDIIRIEADGSYSNVFLSKNRKMLVCKNLSELEEMLPNQIFFRSHKSHLINLNLVKRFIRNDGGMLEMNEGTVVTLSRRQKEEFMQRMTRLSNFQLS